MTDYDDLHLNLFLGYNTSDCNKLQKRRID